MQYYLDTNVVYNLKRLPEQILAESYTSFLAILEIVAGIDESSYLKRRSALKAVVDSKLLIYWDTPDMIIFDSFNAYNDFSMSDGMVNELKNAMLKCIAFDSYHDFSKILIGNISVIEYFKNIDNGITQKFTTTFPALIPSIKKSALIHNIAYKGVSMKIDFTEIVKLNFINKDKHAMLVGNLARGSQYAIENSKALDKPIFRLVDVVNSYNGRADFFIYAWLTYALENIGRANLPGRNDFQDLLHFLYLRNYVDIKIISDDGLFNKLFPEYSITFRCVLANNNQTK